MEAGLGPPGIESDPHAIVALGVAVQASLLSFTQWHKVICFLTTSRNHLDVTVECLESLICLLICQIFLLFIAFIIGHFLSRRGITWLGDAGVALLLGVLLGVVVKFSTNDNTAYSATMRSTFEFQASAFWFELCMSPVLPHVSSNSFLNNGS